MYKNKKLEIMRKVLLSVLILVSTITLGQDKFSMTVGSELMNFHVYKYNKPWITIDQWLNNNGIMIK